MGLSWRNDLLIDIKDTITITRKSEGTTPAIQDHDTWYVEPIYKTAAEKA